MEAAEPYQYNVYLMKREVEVEVEVLGDKILVQLSLSSLAEEVEGEAEEEK